MFLSNKQLHDRRSFHSWRWQIFFITWLAYTGLYFTRKSFSAVKMGMSQDPNLLLDKIQMSQLDFAYLMAYAIGQFILGMFGDRVGARRIVLTGLFLSSVFAICMGTTTIFWVLLTLFTLQGFVQATGWAPLSKNLSYWFKQSERGMVMGWWSTNYTIGGLIASPLAAFCADHFGSWKYGFIGPALALLLVWGLFLVFQRNRPEDVGYVSMDVPVSNTKGKIEDDTTRSGQESNKDGVDSKSTWQDIAEVLKNPMVWLLGFVYFCLKPTRYAILLWGPVYIAEKIQTGMTESSLISICFELGGFFGVIASGYISDKFFQARRIPISIICLFGLGILMIFFDQIVCQQSKILIILTLSGIGLLLYAPDSLLSGVAAVDFGKQKGASTAAGFINGCGSLGAIMGGSLPGIVSQKWGWNWLFWSFALSLIIAAIVLIPFRNVVANSGNTKS